MRYPVIFHKDGGSDYGVTVPDFPGVFSGGGTLDEALANVQDAIETFYEGEEVERLPDILLRWRACLPLKTRKAGPWCWWM